MRTAITIITTAALLLHFSLGCWAHNEHAASDVACALDHSDAAHSHCHEGDEQHSEPAPGDELPGGECSQGQCFFTIAGKVLFTFGVDVSFFMPVVTPKVDEGTGAQIAVLLDGNRQSFGPAVRPHLFNQVILI